MLPSQRALFDMPRDVCFMNAAAWSPLPLASQEAGRAAVGRKGQPWKLPDGFQGSVTQPLGPSRVNLPRMRGLPLASG